MPGKSTVGQRGRPKSIVSQAGDVVREVFDSITGTDEPRRRRVRRPGVRKAGTRKVGSRKASAAKKIQPAVKRAKAIVSNLKGPGKKRGPKKRASAARASTARAARSRSTSTGARAQH